MMTEDVVGDANLAREVEEGIRMNDSQSLDTKSDTDSDNDGYHGNNNSNHRTKSIIGKHHDELEQKERGSLSKKSNTKTVSFLKSVLILVLLFSATFFSTIVYFYSKQQERNEFETHFKVSALKVIKSFHNSFERKLLAADAFSMAITSYAITTTAKSETDNNANHDTKTEEGNFPFVTLPHFVEQGSNSRVVSDGVVTYWLPLVTNETKTKWEEYAKANQNWIDIATQKENIYRKSQDDHYTSNNNHTRDLERQWLQQLPARGNNTTYQFHEEIFCHHENDELKTNTDSSTTAYYLPIWQMTPVLPSMKKDLNFNMLAPVSFLAEDLQVALDSEMVVMSKAIEFDNDDTNHNNQITYSNTSSSYNEFLNAGQYRHQNRNNEDEKQEPTSNLIFPVFDNFGTVITSDNKEEGVTVEERERSLVGIVMTSIYWSFYFKNTLPANTKGVIVVLENTKNQSYTYQINGNEVVYIGEGDLHDSTYDHLEVFVKLQEEDTNDDNTKTNDDLETSVSEALQDTVTPTSLLPSSSSSSSYTMVGLNTDYCKYTIRVYPSQVMEDIYITNQPVVFSMTVALIFLFTSFIFIIYDCYVERRQSIVMNRAVVSGAMVSSLFPENVQGRLFNNTNKTKSNSLTTSGYNKALKSRILESSVSSSIDGNNIEEVNHKSEPIADTFLACTVMFADIAGFTAWSSTRTPKDVFILLETIYNAFDKIAIRKNVFKVETIGDCYVAVTGLPNPQVDHAVIMSEFAISCLQKMNKLFSNPVFLNNLGQDTINLKMRIGLHSGPVTGGVLRGQKARFQLFGDTMNTASRIETNGKKGQIHISQQTADELVANGKSHWILPREDKIIAKGKGELQTYWLTVPSLSQHGSETLNTESQ